MSSTRQWKSCTSGCGLGKYGEVELYEGPHAKDETLAPSETPTMKHRPLSTLRSGHANAMSAYKERSPYASG